MTITLAQNAARVSYSVSEGATQTSFTVSFEFFDAADLNVYVDGTLKTISTHYTVSGGSGSTGAVAISVTGASGGSTVVITRSIALARTTDFPSSGSFQIATLNTELDRFTAIAADLKDSADRALILSDSDSSVSTTLPLLASRKGTVLGFNASSGAVEAGPSITAVQTLSAASASINLLGTAAVVEDMGLLSASAVIEDMGLLGTAAVIEDMGLLATSAVIEDMGLLATSAVIEDMGLLGTSANVTAMGLLGNSTVITNISNLSASAVIADMAILATTDVVADMNTLATSDIVADMNLLATSAVIEDMGLLATSAVIEDMGLLATSAVIEDMGLLATSAVIEDMGLLATSAVIEDMGLLATSSVISDMSTLAGSGANPNITSVTASGAVTAGSLIATTSMTVQNASGTEGVFLNYNENGGELQLLGTSGNTKLLIDYLDSDNDGNGLGRILNLGAGSTGVQIGVANASNTGGIIFSTGNNVTRQLISNIGDITNYNTDGSTAKMTWDASENNLTFVDGAKATFGNSADLQVYHDGSDSYVDDAGTGALILRGNSNVTIGKYTGETMGFFEADGAVSLYHNNAVKLATAATGVDITGACTVSPDTAGKDTFLFTSNAANDASMFLKSDTTNKVNIQANGDSFFNGGNVMVGTTDTTLYNNSTGTGTKIGGDGRLDVARQGDTVATFNRTGSSNGEVIRIVSSGTTVGNITISGSNTAYNTSSDYRLKTDAQPMTGASARVLALNPVNFKWIADGTRVDGFLAHEAQAVVPECVTGTKDAMRDEEYQVSAATGDIYTPATDEADEVIHSANAEQPETLADGKQWRETTPAVMGTRSVPDLQGIDQSKIVPLLVAALQEALARITALEG